YANPAEGLGDSGNDGSSLPPARRDILRSGSFVPCAADRGRKTQPERNLAGAQRRELGSAGARRREGSGALARGALRRAAGPGRGRGRRDPVSTCGGG